MRVTAILELKLTMNRPNDQKLFYTLLLKYREEQLENYVPGIDHSTSDYHHVRPSALTKAYSTCHFPQPNARAHGRQVSKFTVISNAAETEMSYDPFKASRPQHLNGFRNSTVKITIHRNREDPQGGEDADENTLGNASRQTSRAGSIQRGLVPPKGYASRSSLASSTRSGNSGAHVRPSVGRKRGVSFSHLRKASFTSQINTSTDAAHGRHSKYTEVTDDGGSVLRAVRDTSASARYIRSRKAQSAASQPILMAKRPGRTSQTWIEDVQQLSSSLAKDCDEAFNHHSVISNGDKSSKQDPTPVEISNSNRPKATHVSLESRPLPTPPARTESVKNELLEARKLAELRKKSGGNEPPGYLDRMVSHIDRLIQPGSPVRANGEPRSSSAPVENRAVPSTRPLPSIHEAGGEELTPRNAFLDHQSRVKAKGTRIASAPEPRELNRNRLNDRFTNPDSLYRDTIRAVQPSSPPDSPVKPPAPLTIRKKSAQGGLPSIPPPMISGGLGTSNHPLRPRQSGLELRQQYHVESRANATPDLHPIDENQGGEDIFADESTGTIVRKKSSWFKRSSRSCEGDFQVVGPEILPSQSSNGSVKGPHHRPPIPHLNNPLPETPKKKGFSLGKFFKKRNNKQDMTIGSKYRGHHSRPES
jgi:serine/threonine-protein kinase HSL1 (negative regulator of Swe1 kinase)